MEAYRSENQYGHAVHFLKRLERADGEAAELALQLYHDPDLVRQVLLSMNIARKCERCAMSLDARDKGPYLVVSTKNGRFVTCLGEGMSLNGLRLIPHEQLFAHIEKSEELRRRLALARELAGEGGELDKLFSRIRTKGDEFSREELLAVSALQPALQIQFFICAVGTVTKTRDLSRYLLSRKRVGAKDEHHLKEYWNCHMAAGHLAVLSGMNNVSRLHPMFKELDVNLIGAFCGLLRSGAMYNLIRIVWLIGKIGPPCFPHCRHLLLHPDIPETWIVGLLGVVVIGLRHKKCRAEARKSIASMIKVTLDYSKFIRVLIANMSSDFYTLIGNIFSLFETPEKVADFRHNAVRTIAFEMIKRTPLKTLYTWEKEEEIPIDIASTIVANFHGNFLKNPKLLSQALLLTQWLSECEAEDLYLPKEAMDVIHTPWSADTARDLLNDEGFRLGKPNPVTVDKSPRRNDPCPCGSGKKFKKCCIGHSEPTPEEVLDSFYLNRHRNSAKV